MKEMFESEEIFTAHATISAGYVMIQEYYKVLNQPRSPIDVAIDNATGFDKHRQQGIAKNIIVCLKDIIKAKKVIEADYSKDEEMIKAIKKLIK